MKIHPALMAPLVVVAFLGVIMIGKMWELPSMQKQFNKTAGETKKVDMIVQGLRCRGTSNFFMKVAGEIPGVVSVSTYVQEHKATISYDTSKTKPEEIAAMVEKPIRLNDGRMVSPFKVLEIKN